MKLKCTFASTRPVQIATGVIGVPCAFAVALPPHAPCRLQHAQSRNPQRKGDFASTRPVQIATQCHNDFNTVARLCLHTPRADCNKLWLSGMVFLIGFASTRPVQIATRGVPRGFRRTAALPPHAPCRLQRPQSASRTGSDAPLPPHAPCRLQPRKSITRRKNKCFASTRPVQIATTY